MTLGLNNLNFAWHLDHCTLVFHGAVSFSFGGGNINHVALLLLVAVRFLDGVGNFDGVAFGLLVTIGFSFVVGDLDGYTFGFALVNINGLGSVNLDLGTFLDLLAVRFLDSVRYINKSAVGNLDIDANSLGAGNLGGDLSGDIFANLFGDLLADRPLSPAVFLFRRARITLVNKNGFANIFNLGFYLVFHDSSFMTFLLKSGGASLFLFDLGDILKVLFTFIVTFLLKLEVGNLPRDFVTNLLTLLFRSQERYLAGFLNTDIFTFLIIPKS